MRNLIPKCIFCESTTGPFNTREHILPESLGGGDWAILSPGFFCDKCQNIFGSFIEQHAVGDYPFNQLRVLLAIPTKKGKAPWFNFGEGTVKASLRPYALEYEPSAPFKEPTNDGRKTQIRIVAHPLKPKLICRFLLKMAIEVIANHDIDAVFESKYDKARQFALQGIKSCNWWYLQRENILAVDKRIKTGIRPPEWAEPVKLEVTTFKNGAEIFYLKILYLEMFVPLEPRIVPVLDEDMKEPEYRLFTV